MSSPTAVPVSGNAPVPQVPTDVNDEGTVSVPPAELSKEARQKAITEEYSKATTWLREQHRDEFHTRMKQQLAARSIEWQPQPTKQEKAAAEIQRLAAEAGLIVQVSG